MLLILFRDAQLVEQRTSDPLLGMSGSHAGSVILIMTRITGLRCWELHRA